MHPVPETFAGHAGQAVANDYDSFAEAYAAETEVSIHGGPRIAAACGCRERACAVYLY